MRFRERGTPTIEDVHQYYSANGGPCNVGTKVKTTSPGECSVIIDKDNSEVRRQSKKDYYPPSPILHYVRRVLPDDDCFLDTGTNQHRWGRTFSKAWYFVWLRDPVLTERLFVVDNYTWYRPPHWDDDFPRRAVMAMRPRIHEAVLAPVEIWETVTGWKQLLGKDFWTDLIKFGDNKTLAHAAVQKASGLNLWYQFGVAPLIGSVIDVLKRLETFQKDLNNFINFQSKPVKAYYSEKEEYLETDEEMTPYHGSECQTLESKCRFGAVAVYHYRIPRLEFLSREVIDLLALADMLGIGSIRAMMWEKIPYSFVLDWFFSVGDWVSQFDKPLLDVDVVYTEFQVSSKQKRKAVVRWLDKTGTTCADVGKLEEELYWRTSYEPPSEMFAIQEAGPLTVRKILLGGSLIGVRS